MNGFVKAGVFSVVASFGLQACTVQYEGFNETELQKFYTTMIANECRVTIETADAFEAESGLAYETLEAISDHLKERGDLVLLEDELGAELKHEGCQ